MVRASLALLCVLVFVPSLALAQTPEAPASNAPPDAPPDAATPTPAEVAPVAPPTPAPAPVETPPAAETPASPAAPASEGLLESFGMTPTFDGRLYGYIDSYFEYNTAAPAGVGDGGQTAYGDNKYEWDIFNLNVMVQGTVFGRFRYFLNLAGPGGDVVSDSSVDVRNAWVEAPLFGDLLNVRVGKTYRRFGLYNEILDASPTFIGIEPPELFDGDHLMLSRTTNLMVHGRVGGGDHLIGYAAMTGNDEKEGLQIPIGADLFYDYASAFKIGSSFYWTGGAAVPSRDVGDGPPGGGVINWMAEDNYFVAGGYAQLTAFNLTLQAEGWLAPHTAKRDPDKVLQLLDAGLNKAQLARFGLGKGASSVEGDVVVDANYTVATWYARAGYSILLGETDNPMEIVPYLQFDYFSNPETIASEDFGGDDEAGISDDGIIYKATAGVVFRPVPAVALKLDGSTHHQTFNGQLTTYLDVRMSFSYFWELGGLR